MEFACAEGQPLSAHVLSGDAISGCSASAGSADRKQRPYCSSRANRPLWRVG